MAQKEEIKKIIECLELITKRIKKIEKEKEQPPKFIPPDSTNT